ncbi:hypothetical protein Hanom_Chr05g00439711 [Helianthus anomalus]
MRVGHGGPLGMPNARAETPAKPNGYFLKFKPSRYGLANPDNESWPQRTTRHAQRPG